jgi:hypothetical protein
MPTTPEQLQALSNLRKELSKLDNSDPKNAWALQASDAQCLKFLIGHKLKVDEAFKLMVKCSAWRLEYKADGLIKKIEASDAPQEIRFAKAYLPMGVIGKDSEGRPIMLNRMSAIDFPRVLGDFGLDKAIEYAIYVQEKLLENNPNGECVVIIDLGIEDQPNPPMGTLMEARAWIASLLKFLQPFAAIVDPFYPEMFSKIFFTRAPAMFSATWSIAKNFVAEATREKIEILGSKGATKRLLEVLPRESVPVFLGGTNQLAGLGKGGKLPKGASVDIKYLEKLEQDLRDRPGVEVTQDSRPAELSSVDGIEREDDPLQKRAALDILRAAIHVEMTKMAASSERGSWQFVPGKDFLENLEDDELEETLQQYDYDSVKSFQALYSIALKKETIQLPLDPKKPSEPQKQEVATVIETAAVKKKSWLGIFSGKPQQ